MGAAFRTASTRARDDGHEVLLQIPLEPNDWPKVDPGPHTLLTTLPPEENMKRLQWLMSRYTGYVGVTNHMGNKFETSAQSLEPMLEELKRRGLLYVDDGVPDSTAGQIANTIGLDYSLASVQIDGSQSAAEIAKQLAKLEAAGEGARHRHRRGAAQIHHRQADCGMGRQARRQGHRPRAGQRRSAVAAAKLNELP